MKRIGITQRVVYQRNVNERRDALDQNWYAFAAKVGIQLYPIPNALLEPAKYAHDLQLDGLIFSGGNNLSDDESDNSDSLLEKDVAVERDYTEVELLKWAASNNKPLIGICRGMQLIYTYFGGVLTDVDPGVHVAKEHVVTFLEEPFHSIYGSNKFCNSYHRRGMRVDDIPEKIEISGSFEQEIEAIRHKSLLFFGVMWHPERYTPFREEDINIFLEIFNLNQQA